MARCGCPSSCAAFVIAQSMLEAARRAGSPVVERSRPPTERAGAPKKGPRGAVGAQKNGRCPAWFWLNQAVWAPLEGHQRAGWAPWPPLPSLDDAVPAVAPDTERG